MLSRITRKSAPILAVLLLASITWAQSIDDYVSSHRDPATKTLTITVKGTIGPILSGPDPLGLDGLKATLTIMASESLSPTKHTATSATYTLPAGAIKVVAGKHKLTTKSPSKLVIDLTSSADTATLAVAGPDGLQVTDAIYLKTGSWTTAVLKHPTVFSPSPQKLSPAKTASGAGNKIKYSIEGTTTVLGFTGTASNSDPVDPVLPDPSLSEENWE